MLELPVTVRLPKPDEVSHRPDIEEIMFKRKKANITQGFVFRKNNGPQLPFAFYAEININNSNLWNLFIALTDTLPTEVSCEYGLYEDEQVTTEYFSKDDVLQKLAMYKEELTADCMLEFGLLALANKQLNEIFVTESKYIRYWGIDKEAFLQCMASFNLIETPDLAFIDEFPKVTEPLKKFIPTVKRTEEVIRSLNRMLQVQP